MSFHAQAAPVPRFQLPQGLRSTHCCSCRRCQSLSLPRCAELALRTRPFLTVNGRKQGKETNKREGKGERGREGWGMMQGDKKGKGMSLTEPYLFHWLQHPNTAQLLLQGHRAGETLWPWSPPPCTPHLQQHQCRGRASWVTVKGDSASHCETSPHIVKPHSLGDPENFS